MKKTRLLTAMLVLAVAGGRGGNKEKRAATPTSQAKADQNHMNPQPREKLRQGGKMTWAINQVVANFNFGELDGTLAVTNWIISAVLPQLFNFDASGTPSFNPNYLSGEPKLSAGPPQVVSYQLNPKAIWYDG